MPGMQTDSICGITFFSERQYQNSVFSSRYKKQAGIPGGETAAPRDSKKAEKITYYLHYLTTAGIFMRNSY